MKQLVAGIIIKDGKVLTVHNIKHGLRVEPPGGKIESGEDPEKALKREMKEELGIEVEIISFFGEHDTKSAEGDFSVKMYICKIIKGEPKIPESEGEKLGDVEWYTFDELESLKEQKILAPNLSEALPRLREEYRELKPR